MGRPLDRLEQLAFAQLADLAQDRKDGAFPPNGSFVKAKRGDASYWYYQGYERRPDEAAGAKTRTYVGPVGDPETERLRAAHEAAHDSFRERRRIAASLRRGGLPSPAPFDGAVIGALARAGVFDTGAVLVGSMAFQAYSGLIGHRLEDALMQTGDVDIGRPRRVSVHLPNAEASEESLETLLKDIDPTFTPIHDPTRPSVHVGYQNAAKYKVEFLTTEGRRSDRTGGSADADPVPAQPIAFLEYLLEQPTRSVLLHNDGIPVVVPDPARYAIHKLIVAIMRERIAETRGAAVPIRTKVSKDLSQAASLITTLHQIHRDDDIAAAWEDAWRRGPSWRRHLQRGVGKMPPGERKLLEDIVLTKLGPAAWPTEQAMSGAGPAPKRKRPESGNTKRKGQPADGKKPGGIDPFG